MKVKVENFLPLTTPFSNSYHEMHQFLKSLVERRNKNMGVTLL